MPPTKKLHESLQYTYSPSFRQIYTTASTPSPTAPPYTSPTRIILQYQTLTPPSSTLKQPSSHPANTLSPNRPFCQNPIKRLHTDSKKKYSFTVFVKKSRKGEQERRGNCCWRGNGGRSESGEKRGQGGFQKDGSRVDNRARRRFSELIKTVYENFITSNSEQQSRKSEQQSGKSENKSRKSQSLNKTSQNLSQTSPNTQSPNDPTQPNKKLSTSITKSPPSQASSRCPHPTKKPPTHQRTQQHTQVTQDSQHTSPPTRLQFIKTMTFGEKLHHCKELQSFRSRESARTLFGVARKQSSNGDFRESLESGQQCFLRIERCRLEGSMREGGSNPFVDVKDVRLRERLQKENAQRKQELMMKTEGLVSQGRSFAKYVSEMRDNRYVAEMREVKKKGKKHKWNNTKGEEDGAKNTIEPW